ncbi:glutamate receptor 3.1-like [Magnolia sinica]|uniref:glutamate receptor 3.1-like n=1 Tax=Magnolia sinica TaxID=86752 RepID=UPI00265B1B30|nr:glutamate receptor 3.1-like [Magnolia sinica]XP_058098634.1 glutamate receptor 3.1-like [Magnolia sinica]
MKLLWFVGLLVFFWLGALSNGLKGSATSRPPFVNIGAIFTINSTIGRAAKIAIETAVEDVNADPRILGGTELKVRMQDSNCSGFLGIVEAFQFMETDILAIVGPQSSVIAHVISHVANELKVPLVSFAATDPTLSSLQYPFFVRTTHSDLFQMGAIAEIVEYFRWRQVITIFIDDDYGRNGIAALGDKLAERRCKISYKAPIRPGSGLSKSEVTDVLIQVALMESRVIVLHANPDSGLQVLSVAHYLGMIGNGYVWIATDWLSSILDSWDPLSEETMQTMQGVLTLRMHTADSERKRALVSRWSKLTSERKATSSGLNSFGLYAYDTIWIIAHAIDNFFKSGGTVSFSNDSRLHDSQGGTLNLEAMSIFDGGDHLLNYIHQTNLTGVTGLLHFEPGGVLSHPAYDIMNVAGTGYRRIGYWCNYSGLSVMPPETLYEKPPNRSSANQQLLNVIWPGETTKIPRGWVFPNNGKELRIGIPKRVSYREFVSQVPGTDIVKGFCIDVFTAAINLLPYAVPYRFIPFGNGQENPDFSELVRQITTDNLDAVVGDIAIVTNRTKIVDFTQPFIESGLVIVAPVRKLNSSAWAFLQPFTVEMWCVTAVFFLVIGAVVWILEHRMNDDFRGPPKKQFVTILW